MSMTNTTRKYVVSAAATAGLPGHVGRVRRPNRDHAPGGGQTPEAVSVRPAPRVLLLDGHTLFREALAALLRLRIRGAFIRQTGEVTTAMAWLREGPAFDLVLADPGVAGPQSLAGLVEAARNAAGHPRVVAVAAEADSDAAMAAYEQGARGFVPKSASGERLVHVLDLVLEGGLYFPPEPLARCPRTRPVPQAPPSPVQPCSSGMLPQGAWRLSAREREILEFMVRGLPNKAIARELATTTEATVRKHVSSILRKMGVRNRVQAVVLVLGIRAAC